MSEKVLDDFDHLVLGFDLDLFFFQNRILFEYDFSLGLYIGEIVFLFVFFDLFFGLSEVSHDEVNTFVDKSGFNFSLFVFFVNTSLVVYLYDGVEQVFTPVDVAFFDFEMDKIGFFIRNRNECVRVHVFRSFVISADRDIGCQLFSGHIMWCGVENEISILGRYHKRKTTSFYFFVAFECFIDFYDNVAGFVDTDFKIEGCAESIFYRRRGVYFDGIVFIKVFFVEKAVSKYIFFIQAQIFYDFSQGGMCRNHVDFVIDFASAPYEITE